MAPKDRKPTRAARMLLAVGWCLAALPPTPATADDGAPPRATGRTTSARCACGKTTWHLRSSCNRSPATGPLGFGLNYHPGLGYGGPYVGVGPAGGYPWYGGPGYPHPAPCLNRFGRELPFVYFGGPGFPSPEHPNFYGEPGALALDEPVIETGLGSGQGDYGNYTGLVPYPEATFAPFTTALGTAGSAAGINAPPTPNPAPPTPPALAPSPDVPSSSNGPLPGAELVPVVDAAGKKGLRVVKVTPGSLAEDAGLKAGDEIRSANRYATEKADDLAWVATNAAEDHVLRLDVRLADTGRNLPLNVRLR